MRRPEALPLLESVDENGNTPMHLAAAGGDVAALQVCLKRWQIVWLSFDLSIFIF